MEVKVSENARGRSRSEQATRERGKTQTTGYPSGEQHYSGAAALNLQSKDEGGRAPK